MTDLIGIYWQLLLMITPPWIDSKNLISWLSSNCTGSITGSITGNATGIIWQVLFKSNGGSCTLKDRSSKGAFEAIYMK